MLHEKNFAAANVVTDLPTRSLFIPSDDGEGCMSLTVIDEYESGPERQTHYSGSMAVAKWAAHCRERRRQQHV